MANLLYLADVQAELAYMLGEEAADNPYLNSYLGHIQAAMRRIYRMHDWDTLFQYATVTLTAGVGNMPTNIRATGTQIDVRSIVPGLNNDIILQQIDYSDQDSFTLGDRVFWITEDTSGNLILNTSETTLGSVTVAYEPTAPVLSASVGTNFPDARVIAQGAYISVRAAEDPDADIGPEEDNFQVQCNEIYRAMKRARPQRRAVGIQERTNTYTGDVRNGVYSGNDGTYWYY